MFSRLLQLEKNRFSLDNILSSDVGSRSEFSDKQPARLSKYVAVDDVSAPVMLSGFQILHWNCHLTTSHEDVVDIINKLNSEVQVIGICESFISEQCPASLFNFPGYTLISKNRSLMGRGGLAFIIKDDIKFKVREDLSLWIEGKIETFAIEIVTSNNNPLLISSVYRPPGASPDFFLEEIEILISEINRNFDKIVIIGDFNFDLLDLQAKNLDFLNVMLSFGLFPLNSIPSRLTDHSATLIDNVFVTEVMVEDSMCDVLIHSGSDHLPLLCLLQKLSHCKIKRKNKILRRDMKEVNLAKFKNEVSSLDWEVVYNEKDDASKAFNIFSDILYPVFEKNCPLNKINCKKAKPRKPWINDEILSLIRQRNKLYCQYLDNPSEMILNEFKELRNYVNNSKRNAKNEYYLNRLKIKEGNIKDTWGIVREVIGCEKKDMCITNLKTSNRIIHDKLEIANYMGDYFSKIGSVIQNEVSRGSCAVNIKVNPSSMQNGFEFVPCNVEEVEKIVCSLKSNSSGVDGLNLKAFNYVSVYLLPVLVHLINLSMVKGHFPSELKQSKIIPLHKGGDPSEPCNWRPISILPLFSKIYEKVIYKRLYDFLDSKKILYNGQFGFRSKHSTSHAVHHLLSFVDNAFENNMIPLTVFVDFRKAFDTVDFNTLLSRLSGLGLGSTCVKWFSSYLHGRTT